MSHHDDVDPAHADGWQYAPGMRYESSETIRHRVITDIIPPERLANPRVAEGLGYVHPSPDVQALDLIRLVERKKVIREILPAMGLLIAESLQVTEQAILIDGNLGMTDREKQIASTVTVAVVSSLLDMGIVTRR
ncbi:hypothetical protein [Terracoccus sp. 273MFTsu3.1]|uniref:hypothetical protein n=1 Tax=Terracoccus sp. 273MFTsu3.1 TaxID=1172188 RepID=UPI0003678816|nr:hypothetical protein [Terracoccus sp. 273MFTsu3.1]